MKKIIIIGAGPAGLTAGYELIKTGKYEVTILEQSDSIGGISKTVNHNGNRMDMGGHRFFSKSAKVNEWWNNMLPKELDSELTDKAMLVRKRVSRIFYDHKLYDYPVKLNKTTLTNMGAGRTIKVGCSYLKAMIHKLPETSLENFYINRFGEKLYEMFFKGYTEKLWGRAPKEISADWGAQRVKGLSIKSILKGIIQKKNTETSLIEEFLYPKYGPGQMWETTADRFISLGGKIEMNCRVKNVISDEPGRVNTVRYEADGREVTVSADYVLSSMPLSELISGMNDVPEIVKAVAQGLPYRDFLTIGLLVDKLALKSTENPQKLIPDCWLYVQDDSVKLGRIQVFNNWSPYMVKNSNKVWLGLEFFCKENDNFWNKTDKELAEQGISELKKIGMLDDECVVSDYHCERVKKAYPAYFDTYKDIDKIIEFLDKYENLYCIGRNGQHRYNNMDHSMMTAFEAVNNIMTGKTTKENVWNVNTEKEYHESGAVKSEKR